MVSRNTLKYLLAVFILFVIGLIPRSTVSADTANGTCTCYYDPAVPINAYVIEPDNCNHATSYALCLSSTSTICNCEPIITDTSCSQVKDPCCGGNVCGNNLVCYDDPTLHGTSYCLDQATVNKLMGNTSVCDFLKDAGQKQICNDCLRGTYPNKTPGAWTAIGCIPTDFTALIKILLDLGVGIAGGIAFLLILLGGFQIMTSAGNPEQLEAGKELVTSAITGLILIVFSVFILKLIGVDILGIPSFH